MNRSRSLATAIWLPPCVGPRRGLRGASMDGSPIPLKHRFSLNSWYHLPHAVAPAGWRGSTPEAGLPRGAHCDPWRAPARGRAPSLHTGPRQRTPGIAQHRAWRLRATPRRGIRADARGLRNLRRASAVPKRSGSRTATGGVEPGTFGAAAPLGLREAPRFGPAAGTDLLESPPRTGRDRLPLRRARLFRPAPRHLGPAARPTGASPLGETSGLPGAGRSPGAARRIGRLPLSGARRAVCARPARGGAGNAAGDRPGDASFGQPGRLRRPRRASLPGILTRADRARREAGPRARGRRGPLRRGAGDGA